MKRLFRIGGGLFVLSSIPILMWPLLSLIYNEPKIASVFTMVYFISNIKMILSCIFGSGANIRQAKEKDVDAIQNGMFWGIIFATIIFGILVLLTDDIIAFMEQDVDLYRIWVIYWIVFTYLRTLLSYVLQKLYFEDKEKIANIHLTVINVLSITFMCGLSLIFHSPIIAITTTLAINFVYLVVLFCLHFKRFKLKFNFLKNSKYESGSIVSLLIGLVILLFGVKTAFVAGPEYAMALSLVALATDSQWDMMKAISIVAKVDLSKNRYEYIKQLKNSYIYTLFVVLIVVLMTFILCLCYEVSLIILLIYLSFHIFDFLLTPPIEIWGTFTQIEYSSGLSMLIYTTTRAFRAFLCVVMLTPYTTVIAQLIQTIMLVILFFIIRKLKYEVKDGKLCIKPPKSVIKQDIGV